MNCVNRKEFTSNERGIKNKSGREGERLKKLKRGRRRWDLHSLGTTTTPVAEPAPGSTQLIRPSTVRPRQHRGCPCRIPRSLVTPRDGWGVEGSDSSEEIPEVGITVVHPRGHRTFLTPSPVLSKPKGFPIYQEVRGNGPLSEEGRG